MILEGNILNIAKSLTTITRADIKNTIHMMTKTNKMGLCSNKNNKINPDRTNRFNRPKL